MPIPLKISVQKLLGRFVGACVAASLAVVGKSNEPLPAASISSLRGLRGDWFVLARLGPGQARHGRVRLEPVGDGADTAVQLAQHPTTAAKDPVQWSLPAAWTPWAAETTVRQFLASRALRLEYRIVWVSDDRAQIILARRQRDHLWWLSRRLPVSAEDRRRATERIRDLGYDPCALSA